MINLLRLGFKDFFTAKFITLSILPLFLSICSLAWLTIWGGGEIFDLLSEGAKSSDYAFIDANSTLSSYAIKILNFSATKWIISILFYVLSTFLTIIISIIIALIVAGFLTPVVAKEINKRHYNYVLKSEAGTIRVLKVMMVEIMKFLGILLVCLPLLFVPVLNFFIINVPFFYIYYKLLLIDVGSNTLDSEKFELALLEGGGIKFIVFTLLFYIISLVPLVGLFFQLYFVIVLSHLFFEKETLIKI
ncbi:EI24 domain-containing protein [Campylobacter concisus]|jgi:putative membrane protein|uniref:EI24 domain-containing protein n=1 Tax=Campylobacter concisus TaxID=199 RepID=A0A7S9R7R8_9BACT|nr:EI24 domain-containing protein [Campylobacter concisus]QPH85107.1 EI24 domain-containing protein [Campylobacter concisus]